MKFASSRLSDQSSGRASSSAQVEVKAEGVARSALMRNVR